MAKYESIIVVGSSGAGKTTLVNGVRTTEFEDTVVVPKRLITRPERRGDDLTENKPVKYSEFAAKLLADSLRPAWMREFEDGRTELYGFELPTGDEDKLKVYSANNAFLRDPTNASVRNVLDSGLVVAVMSPLETRTDRLAKRSRDMLPGERAVRLGDEGIDVLELHPEITVIETAGLTPEQGQEAFRDIVREVLE